MSVSDQGDAVPATVPDGAAYTEVTIVRTDEVGGFVYRRGTVHSVDAATLAALRDRHMLADQAAAAAG